MELFAAHNQWSTRPPDERFPDIRSLHDATSAYAKTAAEKDVRWADLHVDPGLDAVAVVGPQGNPALLTHWAFGQLAARVGAPADYLRNLPAELAARNLNHGLQNRVRDGNGSNNASLLFHQNGGLLCRAITSNRYTRIWNYEVAQRLLDLESQGWQPALPDIGSEHDRAVTALYASDHDMFAFLRHENRTIEIPGRDKPLTRGVIVENSEVGAGALKLTRFLYDYMCCNHIIWGASLVIDLRLRHVGQVRDRMYRWDIALRRYADSSASDEEAKITAARTTQIADTKEGVLDKLFGSQLGLSRKLLDAGYDAVKPEQDGDPKTVWGMVSGLTRHSQTLAYADRRTEIDRAAGRLLSVNF